MSLSMKPGEGSKLGTTTTFPNLTKSTSAYLPQGATTNNNNAENLQPNGVVIREQDQYLPIANVIRIMRRVLPYHAKISDDAKETIQECTSEFISFITGEANEHCQKEQRKTVSADDLIWAMTKLGFDDYVGPLSFFLARYRELERGRGRPRDPISRSCIGPEPMVGLAFGTGPAIDMGLMMPGMFDVGPTMDGLHYIDMSGAGSSSFHLPLTDYDPFGQFK